MKELEEILPFIKEKKCVLFIGSGVSSLAGCSDWNKLVDAVMQNDIIKKAIKPEEIATFNNNDTKLEYCKIQFEKNNMMPTFWGEVRKALIGIDSKKHSEEYLEFIRALKKIDPFPNKIVTTNIDNLLEGTGLFNFHQVYHKIEDFNLSLRPEGIYHIHGYIEDLEHALFVSSQYIPRYSDPSFKEFLISLANENSILFLGSKVEKVILDNMLLSTRENGINHFMLVHDGTTISDSDRTMYADLYNIKVVKYGTKADFRKNMQSWISDHFTEVSVKNPEEDVTNVK